MKKQPDPEVYQLKKKVLSRFERLSENGLIDLYYGDESGVSLAPKVPDGWQFRDEEVSLPSATGTAINCFGMFTRSNQSWTAVSEKALNAAFIVEQLERFCFSLRRLTVLVLENAPIHTGKADARANRSLAAAWFIRVLFADIFAAAKDCGNGVAETEIRMALGRGLRIGRAFAIRRQTSVGGIRRKPQDKVFRLQT